MSVLTVGDGDFSCSLALLRAYDVTCDSETPLSTPQIIRLVATTLLPNEHALLQLYPSASNTVRQLHEHQCCTIVYGVDATKLCDDFRFSQLSFDYILFHHPHLGYNGAMITPSEHNQRHRQLLASYFASARHLLTKMSDISYLHVCLCGKERTRWDLDGILAEGGLQLVHVQPASRPIFDHTQPQTAKLSRTRRGHWLGRHGYCHQPTDPQTTHFSTNVSTSHHYFIRESLPAEATGCTSSASES